MARRRPGSVNGEAVSRLGSLVAVTAITACALRRFHGRGRDGVQGWPKERGVEADTSRHHATVPGSVCPRRPCGCGVRAGSCGREASGSSGFKGDGIHGVLRPAARGCTQRPSGLG
jgi:hypothetical protein